MKNLFGNKWKSSIGDFFCRKVLRPFILIVIVVWVSGTILPMQQVCAQTVENLTLYAMSAVLMDGDSGRILYEKNATTPMAMASTTKIMTCILVLENCELDEVLTVSEYAASMPKVKLYIKKGEKYTIRDMLYSLMLESHNDVAVALAEHVGMKFTEGNASNMSAEQATVAQSKEAVSVFADLMNKKAVELGCCDTWYITPNGLDAVETFYLEDGSTMQKEHHTTAAELAIVMAYCVWESPFSKEYLEITRTQEYRFFANGRNYYCSNHNAFLNMMSGVLSGKTGFTNKAGYCYVAALEQDGRKFVVALLGCGWPNNKSYKWTDTKKLMNYGLDHYEYHSFSEEGIVFDESKLSRIFVKNGKTDKLGQSAYTDVEVETKGGRENAGMDSSFRNGDPIWMEGLLLRADERVEVKWSQDVEIEAPVTVGMKVGDIEYLVDGKVYKRQSIVACHDVEKINFNWFFLEILKRFLLVK